MDVQKLKEAAGAVLGWSNCDKAWLDTSEDESAAVFGHIDEDGNTYPVATIDCDQYYQGQDSLKLARFYAAANPAKVLDLITEIEQLRAENERLKVELSEAKKDAMCWYMTKQWHHADTIARIEESAKQATKGK